MHTIKVVVDSNAFTPQHFHLIDKSPIRKLCNQGKVSLIYGHVFLEETLRTYGNIKKREVLVKDWLPFIADTAKKFCNDFDHIFHEELVQGRGHKANIFMSSHDNQILKERLRTVPIDDPWRAWEKSASEREADNVKRLAQREVSTSIRQEIADWKKAVNYIPKKNEVSNLNHFFKKEVANLGLEFIKVLIKSRNPVAIWCMWSRNKSRYPYFTTFVINMLYIAHYAMTRPNDPIDLNAQADLNLMSHLLHADILLSNETGFLKTAFDDLWRPQGKQLISSVEFADFLNSV